MFGKFGGSKEYIDEKIEDGGRHGEIKLSSKMHELTKITFSQKREPRLKKQFVASE